MDNRDVFINCPFDRKYLPMLRAMVFVLKACGYTLRCAMESDNAAEVRVEKILRIIGECGLGIHDISRTQVNGTPRLPRFNMPFELGLFLGATRHGSGKGTLILDSERYRYQRFLSDIAGQDLRAHQNKPDVLIGEVRNWLNTRIQVPGKAALTKEYKRFLKALPKMLEALELRQEEVSFVDWSRIVGIWLEETAET